MEEVCEQILSVARGTGPDHHPRRLRRRRGHLDRDPRLDPPLARRRVRLVHPRPALRRLRADDVERRGAAAPRHRARHHRRLRDRLRRGGRRRPGRRASRSSSPTITCPGERLPDCPIIHPVVSDYPFEGLCAAGVAHKLATALCDAAGRGAVETVGGRRHPSRRRPRPGRPRDRRRHGPAGRREPPPGARGPASLARQSPRVGLRALMAAASVDPETVDAGALGFRLAPRINAAGRLYRADAGVELMLTDDPDRAGGDRRRARPGQRRAALGRAEGGGGRGARPLGAAGLAGGRPGARPRRRGLAPRRRRHRRLPHGRAPLPADRPALGRRRPGQGLGPQHPRLRPGRRTRRHRRAPRSATAAIAPPRGSSWRPTGSTRSARPSSPTRRPRSTRPTWFARERLDALVGVGREGIGMDLARQLESLGPFGMGNPGPRLLVPVRPPARGPAARRGGQALPLPARERRRPRRRAWPSG